MKEAVLGMLQQRMDGCTRDQMWAVAAISGLNGLLVAGAPDLNRLVPAWGSSCAVLLAGAYAVYFIVNRHRSYYLYRANLADLLAGEESAPAWMKAAPLASEVRTWIGSGFYVLWVVGATVVGVLAIQAL